MAFNWVDMVILCLFVLIVAVEARRGFGQSFFDAIGFFIVLKVTSLFYPYLARTLTLSSAPSTNEAICFVILFVFTAVVCLVLSKLIHGYTLISLEVFDPILGTLCGIVIGTIVSHLFLRFLLLAFASHQVGMELIASSALGEELLEFKTFHSVLETLYHLGE